MAKNAPGAMVFSLEDSSGVRASLRVPMLFDPTSTEAALATAWLAQATLLDAVTGAQIIHGSVVLGPQALTGLKTAPITGELMERVGNVDYPYAPGNKLYDSIIPCVDSGILVSSGKAINESAAAFTAYIAPFETAPTAWVATNNGYVVFSGAHTDTFVSFRKHRARRHQVSEETP